MFGIKQQKNLIHGLIEKITLTLSTNYKLQANIIANQELNNEDRIKCNNLVLAIGHSARDTFYMLNKHKLEMMSKQLTQLQKVANERLLEIHNSYLESLNNENKRSK